LTGLFFLFNYLFIRVKRVLGGCGIEVKTKFKTTSGKVLKLSLRFGNR
jgi:hypothetical protein